MVTPSVAQLAWFAIGLLALSGLTMAGARWAGLALGWLPLVALLRAVVQLSVIALILGGILSMPWTVAAFIVLMLSTASLTAAGRLRELWWGRRAALIGVISGAVVTMALILLLQLVEVSARNVIAVGGIIVGNSMTAATLAGRNFLRAARTQRDQVEAWLSLGATPAQAYADLGREAARESLLPTLDQTRSTGLVTLPGAFVGALFGGASPLVAAQFQLVVLAGIASTMLITAVVTVHLVGRSPYVLTFDER